MTVDFDLKNIFIRLFQVSFSRSNGIDFTRLQEMNYVQSVTARRQKDLKQADPWRYITPECRFILV